MKSMAWVTASGDSLSWRAVRESPGARWLEQGIQLMPQ